MKQSTTTISTGKGPTVKKSKKVKVDTVNQLESKADTVTDEERQAFDGVKLDQNQTKQSHSDTTRVQKPTLEIKTKTKTNSKIAKNKENADSQAPILQNAVQADDAKDAGSR